MRIFVIIILWMGFELRAQESYRVAEFHFPKSVKEVVKTESEINRVTGEKNTFKTVTYFFENQRLQKRITLENDQEITETFHYKDSLLIGYTKNYPDIKSEEKYLYSKTGKLHKVLLLDNGKITAQILLTYDKMGHLIQRLTIADDKTPVRKETFTQYALPTSYNQKIWVKEGKKWLVDEVYHYVKGQLVQSEHNLLGEPYTLLKTYDSHHNLIEDLKVETQDPIRYNHTYDEKGELVKTAVVTNDAVYYVLVEYSYNSK